MPVSRGIPAGSGQRAIAAGVATAARTQKLPCSVRETLPGDDSDIVWDTEKWLAALLGWESDGWAGRESDWESVHFVCLLVTHVPERLAGGSSAYECSPCSPGTYGGLSGAWCSVGVAWQLGL